MRIEPCKQKEYDSECRICDSSPSDNFINNVLFSKCMPRQKKEEDKQKTSDKKKKAVKEDSDSAIVQEDKEKKIKKETQQTTAEETIQSAINIGLVGHVDHGKTTLTEKFTGKWTDTHSEEVKRGITIRLGYADAEFRRCPKCNEPDCFTTLKECPHCNAQTALMRRVSFVDAPGHDSLMATMLSGARIMDGALLLIAANEECPQPQTREHLMALEISGIKNVIIVQNKIDIVPKEKLLRNYEQIKQFLKGTSYENSPIIPISAQHNINIDVLMPTIEEIIPTPQRDPQAEPIMIIARSFDINKPGSDIEQLKGGVLGGSIISGKLKVGEKIEIRPGRVTVENNQITARPLFSTIIGEMAWSKSVEELGPGGSVAIMTNLDPGIVKGDALSGSIIGHPGKLPKIWYELELDTKMLERVVGLKEELKVETLKPGEILMLNINSAKSVGIVTLLSKTVVHCKLKIPICANVGEKVTISRRIETRFRLIGYGIIREKSK
jgi:translation initiation factor 2 subunit 3